MHGQQHIKIWFVFIIETMCVYCAVRTDLVNILHVNFSLYDLGMAQGSAAGLSQRRSGFDPCEICRGQNGNENLFSPQYFDFRCQYHSNSAPHSSSCTCCSYRKDERVKPGNLPKNNVISEIANQWAAIYCHLSCTELTKSKKVKCTLVRALR